MLLRQVPTELIRKIKLKEAIGKKNVRKSLREKSALTAKKIQRTIKEEQKKNKVKAKPLNYDFLQPYARQAERMMLRKR